MRLGISQLNFAVSKFCYLDKYSWTLFTYVLSGKVQAVCLNKCCWWKVAESQNKRKASVKSYIKQGKPTVAPAKMRAKKKRLFAFAKSLSIVCITMQTLFLARLERIPCE